MRPRTIRGRLMRVARHFATGLLALCAAGAPFCAHAQCKYTRLGTVPAAWAGARLVADGSVNGTPMKMTVDTGATVTVISGAFAERMKLKLSHAYGDMVGVGGRSEPALAYLEQLSVGPFKWNRTTVVVADVAASDLDDVLIGGNSLLQRDVEIDGKKLMLYSASGCGDAALAYWADDVPWVATEATTSEDLRAVVTVRINGHPVRALVDTGATGTIVDVSVARQLGVDPNDDSSRVGDTGGFGAHSVAAWTTTFDEIAIGPELVRHARVRVADLWAGIRNDYHYNSTARFVDEQPQMLLGADFVRSHRLLFAGSQHRLYFSYTGGDVFRAPRPGAPASDAESDGFDR